MYIADAHCDTLYALAIRNRDPSTLQATRSALEQGGVALQTYALFIGTHDDPGTPKSRIRAMLGAVESLGVPLLEGPLPKKLPPGPVAVLSIEGGEAIDRLEELELYKSLGVRMIALTWNHENRIGYPALSGSRRGLKPFGFELLEQMGALGIIADLSHLNDQGIEDVLAHGRVKVAASHSNIRELAPFPRNLPRALAREIIRAKGFIGLNFCGEFLAGGRPATLEDVRRHGEAILELGGEKALGMGSDFDGISNWPQGLDSAADFPKLLKVLGRGVDHATLKDIAWGNLWRLYKEAEVLS